jgi:hypothetical protein
MAVPNSTGAKIQSEQLTPFICLSDPVPQSDGRRGAHSTQASCVEQFARPAVWLAGVIDEPTKQSFFTRRQHQVLATLRGEPAHDRAIDETAISGDETAETGDRHRNASSQALLKAAA